MITFIITQYNKVYNNTYICVTANQIKSNQIYFATHIR